MVTAWHPRSQTGTANQTDLNLLIDTRTSNSAPHQWLRKQIVTHMSQLNADAASAG